MTARFSFRQQLAGVVTDEALAGLVGQRTVVTAVGLGDIPLPIQLGQYRVIGATRVSEHDDLSLSGFTDVIIHLELIEEPQPSGEERNHAQGTA